MITGDVIIKGCELEKRMSRLGFFLVMFPPTQLIQCTVLTNRVLKKEKLKETTTGEILNFFVLLFLFQNLNFVNVAICGQTHPNSGMSRQLHW